MAEARFRVIEVQEDTLAVTPRCGIQDRAHPGYRRKGAWIRSHLKKGLRARVLLTPKGVQCGYIEYLPGEYAWRGIEADGYLVIHCVWTYFSEYQRRGLGAALVQAAIDDARRAHHDGVAVVARQQAWLAGSALFLKMGFVVVDTAPPDYELLVLKLRRGAENPRFKGDWDKKLARYGRGLTIIRAGQCPQTIGRAEEIAEIARSAFGLKARIVDLRTSRDAQNAPTPFATFAIIHNGKLLADHPVSADVSRR